MNYMDDASTFERSLLQKARQKHIPVIGALELLPLCNMNCDMCYVRLSRSEMERQGRLRTVEEWVRLAEQMQKAGTVFLLLTGGEPLLFPDFKTVSQASKPGHDSYHQYKRNSAGRSLG